MNILFTVQGEGYGHMTQAIAVNEMLRRHGHRVVAVIAGTNPHRSLPDFFTQAFDASVTSIASPRFVFKGARGVSWAHTLATTVGSLSGFRRSLRVIHQTIAATGPDVIINFLEPLMGVYAIQHRVSIPLIAIGNQFMVEHPAFLKAKCRSVQRFGMRQFVRLAGARSIRVALSFCEADDLPGKHLFVCPPLLRNQLFELVPNPDGRSVVIYIVNAGYRHDVLRWHEANPSIEVHCFHDKAAAPDDTLVRTNLTFHSLDGEMFLRRVADAKAVACTAGFESVSEAAFLNRPLLMVPLQNHIEQYLTGLAAESAGLGILDNAFNISRVLAESSLPTNDRFRSWVNQAETILMRVLTYASEQRRAA